MSVQLYVLLQRLALATTAVRGPRQQLTESFRYTVWKFKVLVVGLARNEKLQKKKSVHRLCLVHPHVTAREPLIALPLRLVLGTPTAIRCCHISVFVRTDSKRRRSVWVHLELKSLNIYRSESVSTRVYRGPQHKCYAEYTSLNIPASFSIFLNKSDRCGRHIKLCVKFTTYF
jgi:hypothetical protein